MPDYGLTPKGPNIKRLDVILDEMHSDLSERWGVDTRQNPESLLNHLLTNIADKIAELWEFGEMVYYSQYPAFAEGISLDNAAQFSGIVREMATKSYYPIHCTGKDGTLLTAGTIISTNTNPATLLTLEQDTELTRKSFNRVQIKIATLIAGMTYSLVINSETYSYTATAADEIEILHGIAAAITDESFTKTVDVETKTLNIEATNIASDNLLVLSGNLTTETVTTIVLFGTNEYGDIRLANGTITKIVKADAGLLTVDNICDYEAGRETETDGQLRESYANKVFVQSARAVQSIRSSILSNVPSVKSVAVYENDQDVLDSEGRPPHSIEVIVDGLSPSNQEAVARQIFAKKAAGIATYGAISVDITGDNGETITIRIAEPIQVYVYWKIIVGIDEAHEEDLPVDYDVQIRNIVQNFMSELDTGDDLIPQKVFKQIYQSVPGIAYIDVALCAKDAGDPPPSRDDDYTERNLVLSDRERAYTTESMIIVRGES